ncbi:MAG: hypothetical protein LBO74_13315, partial [Candidatus Symbiothrix sp.]|nr:hypothetical protein [Candidatus Symbiothrix sp.]
DDQPLHALTSFSTYPGVDFSIPQTITYTDFKKVERIREGNYDLSIAYGVDEQRIKSELTTPAGKLARYYMGDYEEEDNGSNIRKIHYICGGNGLAALYIQNSSGKDTLYYVHTDYQGSLIALSLPDGTVAERYAYDPWGNRRNPNDCSQADTRTAFIVNRGYTMHEHLSEFSLINMNGRVYDPHIAMFLSPDPYVQTPGDWLNYNRYGYCLNNPFKYTDPDGEFWQYVIGAVVGGVINLIGNWDNIDNFWQGLSYFGAGAVAGVVTVCVPSSYALISGGLSMTNSVLQQGFASDWQEINFGQVALDSIIGYSTAYIGGQFSKSLSAPIGKLLGGIKSPLLTNTLTSQLTGTAFGAFVGGLQAMSDDDPNSDFWDGAWKGAKSGFISSTISGVGSGLQYSIENNVNALTGKYNKPLYHYTTETRADMIMNSQLGIDENSWTYLTPDGTKTPLQAKIDLALPSENAAESLILVKPNSIYPQDIILQRSVTGNVYGRGGGGYEMIYNGTINTKHLIRLK